MHLVFLEGKDEEDLEEQDGMLPAMSKGDHLECNYITATQRFTRPPYRYTEASLVKKLEELGIGRPSTYAPTISTIQNRGYVEKGSVEGQERAYRQLVLANIRGHGIKFLPEIEDKIAAVAAENGFDLQKYRDYVQQGDEKDRLRHGLEERKTYDFLLSRAQVESVAADADLSPQAAEDQG